MNSNTSCNRFHLSIAFHSITTALRELRRAGAMAALVGVLAVGFLCPPANAQTSTWTWMGGSSTIPGGAGQPGVYGTLGVPAAGNIPGGRDSAVSWTDSSGNLWLFGGEGIDSASKLGYLNDLWEFNSSTNEWTWMAGSSVRGSNLGQPGVYGTLGTPAAGNIPGGRESAVGWTDSNGYLWLFGGLGFDSADTNAYLNDLWEFNSSTNEWAWMGGSNVVSGALGGQRGIYGTLGLPATENAPGSRLAAVSWTDSSGHLWLFGGSGFDSVGTQGLLNDLWKFDPSTREWAWMGGSSTVPQSCAADAGDCGQPGVYGTLGVPASRNIPGGRSGAVSWTDSSGNFWLFGGVGPDSAGNDGSLNDLWEFNPSTNEWAWMGGSSTVLTCGEPQCVSGVYGTLGVPAAGNVPGGRDSAASWIAQGGNLWLFGGEGYDSTGNWGDLNDLWEFNPSSKEWTWMAGSNTVPGHYEGQPGVYGTLGVPAAGNIPGGRNSAVSWTDTGGNLWLFAGFGWDSESNLGSLNDLWKYQPAATAVPAFTFGASPSSITVSSGGQVTTTLTVTPQNGFSSPVSFACSGLPTGASCSFSPSTVTPSGAAASTKLTITAQMLTAAAHRTSRPLFPATVLALSLCIFGWKKRRGFQLMLLMAIAAGGLALLSGCGGGGTGGGGGGGGGVTPVTSTITVTATSGSIQQSTTISLTVE
jgi:N-acetylneuraminic acid mutarotase